MKKNIDVGVFFANRKSYAWKLLDLKCRKLRFAPHTVNKVSSLQDFSVQLCVSL